MAVLVTAMKVTGRTARSGLGFDLHLDPEHVRAVGFTRVLCDEIGPGIPRVSFPVEFFFLRDTLLEFVRDLGSDCPALLERIEEMEAIIEDVSTSEAFLDLVYNPGVEGRCGDELCYWDRGRNVVVCFQ